MATPNAVDAGGILLFYPGITKFVLAWFGFFESSLLTALHLIFMAVFLFLPSVVSWHFDFHHEFEIEHKFAAVYSVGVPILFLFLSNLVSKLIFSITAKMTARDTILRFLMVDGDDLLFVQNVAIVKSFCREFSSEFRERVSVLGLVLLVLSCKPMMDVFFLSRNGSPFYGLCALALWCYMCLSSVVANGVVYMAAIACKLQLTIFKNLLNEPGNSIQALFLHHMQLRNFLDKFSHNFRLYFAFQDWMWRLSVGLAPWLLVPYNIRQRVFMLSTAEFSFLEMVEFILFWNTRRAFRDLSWEIATISTIVVERRELLPAMSTSAESISKWEEIAHYFEQEDERGFTRYSTSTATAYLVMFLGMLPLAIAALSPILGSTVGAVIVLLGMLPFGIRILTSLSEELCSYLSRP